MITFILIIAISIGSGLGVNALFLKKKPCGAFAAILITGVIAIVAAVIGLAISAVIIKQMGYEIAVEKAIGPAIGIALFATWGTLNRRKKGDPRSEPELAIEATANVAQDSETPTPIANQTIQETPGTISKRTRISVGFAGVSTLLACIYPPWILHLDPSYHLYKSMLEWFGDPPIVEWAFLWEPELASFRRVSIAWDRFSLELLAIGVVSTLLYVFMKDGKWPLK